MIILCIILLAIPSLTRSYMASVNETEYSVEEHVEVEVEWDNLDLKYYTKRSIEFIKFAEILDPTQPYFQHISSIEISYLSSDNRLYITIIYDFSEVEDVSQRNREFQQGTGVAEQVMIEYCSTFNETIDGDIEEDTIITYTLKGIVSNLESLTEDFTRNLDQGGLASMMSSIKDLSIWRMTYLGYKYYKNIWGRNINL